MRLAPLLSITLLAIAVPRTEAASSYDACTGFIDSLPATITTQGTWCLRKDVSTSIASGVAILVDTNNVTLDCNGFKLGGLGAGPATQTTGIKALSRRNTTVRDCAIRGFRDGVELRYTSGSVVEDSLVEGSVSMGIQIIGDGNAVRGNRVTDTGAPAAGNNAYGIYTSGTVDVIDNTVDGVEGQYIGGIYVGFATGATVQENRIRNLAGATSATGIYTSQSPGAFVRENQVAGPGTTGIRCYLGQAMVVRNLISGFGTATSDCQLSGNVTQAPPA